MENLDTSELKRELSRKWFQFAVKRLFDIVVSSVMLLLLSPLFLFIIIWIKKDSEGEAVFKQVRTGLNGEDFTIYKFRTMVKNADSMFNKSFDRENLSEFVFQDKEDPRVTKSGSFLRKTSLDELPQLMNIIKGNMSLIGPRPEIPEITKLYNEYESIRLLVKPGVSGLAQVNGRGDIPLAVTIKHDVDYVRKFSLLLDLKIFLKTFKVVFLREGAY